MVGTAAAGGEFREPDPGDPGEPGEPGLSEAEEGGLDRLLFVEPENESLKLGLCLPDRPDFPRTSLSSESFTGGGGEGETDRRNAFRPNHLPSRKLHLDKIKKTIPFQTKIVCFTPRVRQKRDLLL